MAKKHGKRSVTRDESFLEEITCDLCGRKGSPGRHNWSDETYTIEEIKIESEIGNAYPDGGSSEKTEFDICPECFAEKVVPWLISQGAQPRKFDTEW